MKRTTIAVGTLALAAGFFTMADARAEEVVVPGLATVGAEGDPATQTGQIYVDGDDASPVPGVGTGYIGVNDEEGLVGCANESGGDYDTNRGDADPDGQPGTGDEDANNGNNVISPIPPDPANPPDPGSDNPCTPGS